LNCRPKQNPTELSHLKYYKTSCKHFFSSHPLLLTTESQNGRGWKGPPEVKLAYAKLCKNLSAILLKFGSVLGV